VCRWNTGRFIRRCIAWRIAAGFLLSGAHRKNNRKARYYRLTPAGRKQLAEQTGRWAQLVHAINRVLRPATE